MESSLSKFEFRKQLTSVMRELLQKKDNLKDLLSTPPRLNQKQAIQTPYDSTFISLDEIHKVIGSLRPIYLKCGQGKYEIGNGHISHLAMKCATAAIFPRRSHLDGAFISRAELEMAIKLLKPVCITPSPKPPHAQVIFPIFKSDFEKAAQNLKPVGNLYYPFLKTSFYEAIKTNNNSERTLDGKSLGTVKTHVKDELDDDILKERFTVDISNRLNKPKDVTKKKGGFLSKLKFWRHKRINTNKNTDKTPEGIENYTKGKRISKETAEKKEKSIFTFICCGLE